MKLAVLLLSCSDTPRVTTLTQDWVHHLVGYVADYFQRQSGGRAQLEFRVFDWCELLVTDAQWEAWEMTAGDHVRPYVETQQNVDLDVFDHWALVIDKASSGSGVTQGHYIHVAAKDLGAALLAHELGHAFNAEHANLETGGGIELYGDRFC